MTRIEELQSIFADIDPKQTAVIMPMLPQIAFMEKRLEELRTVPHLRIHPTNPERQEVTAAGKQYREIMQTYTNAVKTLLTVLQRNGSDDGDELMKKLAEFDT